MQSALETSLRLVAEHTQNIEGSWWIIGSTAALLSGFTDFDPDDVDLFGSTETMSAFVRSFGVEPASGALHFQFRSMPYQRISLPDTTPIEIMGNLEVVTAGRWHHLSVTTRVEVTGFGTPLWIPSVREQIAIFELFGRPKDLAKAKILKRGLMA